jgi:hypothetical protein
MDAQVEETKVGDGELLMFKDCKFTKSQTIILRGANDFMLDEVRRALVRSVTREGWNAARRVSLLFFVIFKRPNDTDILIYALFLSVSLFTPCVRVD